MYADDVVVSPLSIAGLQQLLNVESHMKYNARKTLKTLGTRLNCQILMLLHVWRSNISVTSLQRT